MKKNLVSIVVVSYNAEKYIKKTLLSCLNQTYGDFEILLLDNASIDGTVEIAERLSQKDARLKIFRSRENIGPYAGLNFLLDRAEGEYIAIQDHDDIWFPEKIGKQIGFLENNEDCVACGTWMFFYFESRETLILNRKPMYTDFVDHTTLVFRNRGFRYDPRHVLSDEFFEKKTLAKAGKIYCIPEPLVVHRLKKSGVNLSSSRFSLSAKNISDFFSANGLTYGSIRYLGYLLVFRYFSDDATWWIRRKITLRNSEWVGRGEFHDRFPDISL